jgi:hypothetical protein
MVKGYGAGFVLWYRRPFLEDWAILFLWLQEGKIRPVVSGVLPLLEAAKAYELLESGTVVGNIVLRASELPSLGRRQPRYPMEWVMDDNRRPSMLRPFWSRIFPGAWLYSVFSSC